MGPWPGTADFFRSLLRHPAVDYQPNLGLTVLFAPLFQTALATLTLR